MVKHEHAGGQYNARRAEVEEGTRILHRRWPSIVALRDATEAQLVECRQQMPENVFRRCRHIITENKRVELAASALERGDLPAFGALMAEAHRSIRDDFEASCSELDTLVEIASGISGCYGARMTGGGFGGCTVNLVEESKASNFASDSLPVPRIHRDRCRHLSLPGFCRRDPHLLTCLFPKKSALVCFGSHPLQGRFLANKSVHPGITLPGRNR
jgi:hypothetical protein